jgi:hypothetical protein
MRCIAKHTVANNGRYGYSANLANNGGWLFHQIKKEKWMKNSLKCLIAATASVVSSGAFAVSNMENPLYMPKNREVYLKTGAAVMYKRTDSTDALIARGLAHTNEFPVWRFSEDMGYGITDRLTVLGRFGYTHDDDIDRKGMHRGRIGLMYRVLEETEPVVWDIYGEMFLSGITPMKGTYTARGFKFDNYSHGRYGAIFGTRLGKTWDKFTLAGRFEYLQTFGNHNNKIAIDPNAPIPGTTTPLVAVGFPDEISVNLKSTSELSFGFDTNYQFNDTWSIGGGFEYYEHADNGVESVHTKTSNTSIAPGIAPSPEQIAQGLAEKFSDMKDGWEEYILRLNVANQVADNIQLTLFTEYTFDDSHANSQNGTDVKLEVGLRLNARF